MMVGWWAEIVLHIFTGQGEERLQFDRAPIIHVCAARYFKYLISVTALPGSTPHFYTLENSERLNHLPKVIY